MKTRILLSFLLFSFAFYTGIAQVPQGFNYQAVARNETGNPIPAGTSLQVRFTVQSLSTGGTIFWQELHPTVITTNFGVISLVLGTGTRQAIAGSAVSFDKIEWDVTPKYLKTEIYYSSTWKDMGTSQLWSVPYAMVADSTKGITSGTKLSVKSDNDLDPDALFEVKRKDGQTVFAVYPDAVNIYVPRSGKGQKGGFAVGGFDGSKANPKPQDYLRVTPDSVRIYIDPTPTVTAKGTKGGFAVGGYGETKGISDMYFNLTSAAAVNTVIASPQVLWYPKKNAFLAGNVHIAHVDSVGDYSTALGYQSQAPGDYSQAFGYKAKALGDYSTSIGKRSIAGAYSSKHNAFALGNATQATGEDSYAFGSGAQALGEKSFAFGSVGLNDAGAATTQQTTALGDYSVAIGMGAQSQARGSMALGVGSISSGTYSSSLGYYSTAAGSYALGLGYKSYASGYASGVLGFTARAEGYASYAIGRNSYTTANANYSVAIGDSAKTMGYSSAAFGNKAKAKAYYSVAIGYNALTTSAANYAGAFGFNSTAIAQGSIAIGYGAKTNSTATNAGSFGYYSTANAPYSVAVGPYASTGATSNFAGSFGYYAAANGVNSVAVGYGATTSATDASAFGRAATANGTSAMALGTSTTAGGNYSTAIGYGASATGANSISIGINTTATLTNSASFGSSAQATNTNALALGNASIASGTNSTAIGYQSQAQGDKSIAIGSYYSITFAVPRIVLAKGSDGGGTKGTISEELLPIRPIIPISTLNRTFTRANIAQGQYSVAVGNGNLATNGGFVFGSNSDALEFGAVALGTSAAANNKNSVAIGYNTTAAGVYSNAMGNNISANSFGEFALGQFSESVTGTADSWNENDLLLSVGNGIDDANRSNALTIFKNGKSIIRGRYAVSTFNNKTTRLTYIPFPTPHFITRDYVYGIYSSLNRDDAAIEYYYSGYFTSTGTSGVYKGLYADLITSPAMTVTDLTVSSSATMPSVYNTAVGATYRDLFIDNTGLLGYYSSSIRYKKDIEELNDVSWLYNLKPVTFRYKDSNSVDKEIGLIAEDVLNVNPHFVSFNSKGTPETVSYSSLITPLLKAVQDQKKTIESLKSDNDDLRQRLDELEKVIRSLASEK